MRNLLLPVLSALCLIGFTYCNSGADSSKTTPSGDSTTANTPSAAPASGTTDSSAAAAPIMEKYWKLIEVYGKPVKVDSTFFKEAYVLFKAKDKQVVGNGGCNGFGAAYELKDGNGIAITNLISTQMACPALEIENEFTKALLAADNYNIVGDTLILNKAKMAPLARMVIAPVK